MGNPSIFETSEAAKAFCKDWQESAEEISMCKWTQKDAREGMKRWVYFSKDKGNAIRSDDPTAWLQHLQVTPHRKPVLLLGVNGKSCKVGV